MQRSTVLNDLKLPVVSIDGQVAPTDTPKHCRLFISKSEVDSVPLLHLLIGKTCKEGVNSNCLLTCSSPLVCLNLCGWWDFTQFFSTRLASNISFTGICRVNELKGKWTEK